MPRQAMRDRSGGGNQGGVYAGQGARGSRAGRPQPQTTRERSVDRRAAFEAASERASRPGYYSTGNAFGASIDLPLTSAPGYLRFLDISLAAGGGANATTNTVTMGTTGLASDVGTAGVTTAATSGLGTSPAALVQYLSFIDAYNTPIFSGPGYELLYLWPLFSGQVGVGAAADVMKWPTVSTAGLGTGTATTVTGNFFLHTRLPFEIVPAYGCISIGNASVQPRLHVQMAGSSTLYSTAPSTAPTFSLTVDEGYWTIPDNQMEPPGLGTTLQVSVLTATPGVGSASNVRISVPRTGGYITTLIFAARNASGQRMDTIFPALGSNNRIRLWIDSVPVADESIEERIDRMNEDFAGLNCTSALYAANPGGTGLRPAGVIAYSFKTSESQFNLGQLDNLNLAMRSTPGTQIELECTPWGTFSGGPAVISVIVGQIVPRGRLVQGVEILN